MILWVVVKTAGFEKNIMTVSPPTQNPRTWFLRPTERPAVFTHTRFYSQVPTGRGWIEKWETDFEWHKISDVTRDLRICFNISKKFKNYVDSKNTGCQLKKSKNKIGRSPFIGFLKTSFQVNDRGLESQFTVRAG